MTALYGLRHFGVNYQFQVGVAGANAIAEWPYGVVGTGADLTGRLNGRAAFEEMRVGGGEPLVIPADLPHVTVSFFACGAAGDDIVERRLIFTSCGCRLLAETELTAGRDIEDCCSPEIHYRLRKLPPTDECLGELLAPPHWNEGVGLCFCRIASGPNGGGDVMFEGDDGGALVRQEVMRRYGEVKNRQ